MAGWLRRRRMTIAGLACALIVVTCALALAVRRACRPLTFELSLVNGKALYGEYVLVRAVVRNVGNQPVRVYPPVWYHAVQYEFDGVEVTRKRAPLILIMAPSAKRAETLAPGDTLVECWLLRDDLYHDLSPGRHRLSAVYDTRRLGKLGVWTGVVRANALTFEVVEPSGAEANAYVIFGAIPGVGLNSSRVAPNADAAASELMRRYPNSAYVPSACLRVLAGLSYDARTSGRAVAVGERYFSLARDDPCIVKHIAAHLCSAYVLEGRYSDAREVALKAGAATREYVERCIQQAKEAAERTPDVEPDGDENGMVRHPP